MTTQAQGQTPTQPANGNGLKEGPKAAAPLVVTADQAEQRIKSFLLASKARIADVAAKHLNPDRIVRLAAMTVHKDKTGNLSRCTPISILESVMESSRLGLELGGALGHAYLVPYKNGKLYECQFQIGYRGLVTLALRSEKVASVEAHLVYEKDRFKYRLGDNAFIDHEPSLEEDRGAWKHAYCIIRLRGELLRDKEGNPLREIGGGVIRDVMTKAEVFKIRDTSKAYKAAIEYKKQSPWISNEGEMSRKTVARRTLKWAPMSEQLADALEYEDEHEGAIEAEVTARDGVPVGKGTAGLKALVRKGDEPAHDPATGEIQEAPPPDDEEQAEILAREAEEAASARATP